MAALFQRPQIVSRGITFRLGGGQKQRLAACQAGLKQFHLLGHFTFRMEVYYFSPTLSIEQNVSFNREEHCTKQV